MALTLTSESFNEGELLAVDHVLSEAYGFGCSGGNDQTQSYSFSSSCSFGR